MNCPMILPPSVFEKGFVSGTIGLISERLGWFPSRAIDPASMSVERLFKKVIYRDLVLQAEWVSFQS